MSKNIIINSTIIDNKVAIVENNQLSDYFIELNDDTPIIGNIYFAKIITNIKSINATFVDIGAGQKAFLKNEPHNTQNTNYGAEGDCIIVQIIKEPHSNKTAAVTKNIILSGLYFDITPYNPLIGTHNQVNTEQTRLNRIKKTIIKTLPEGSGFNIKPGVRNNISNEELWNDWNNLLDIWKAVNRRIEKAKSIDRPMLVHKELGLPYRIIRDYCDKSVKKIIVDSESLYDGIKLYLNYVDKNSLPKLEYYREPYPVFLQYGIMNEIKNVHSRVIELSNGSNIVFDYTEAMTIIDVNSGKMSDSTNYQIKLQSNIAAGKEIAKQLRLRDIGGIIIIDFINMQENYQQLYNALIDIFKEERVTINFYPITKLGLLQISRERSRKNISETMNDICSVCNGTGKIFSQNAILGNIENWLKNYSKERNDFKIELVVNPNTAKYLCKGEYSLLTKLRLKYFLKIDVIQAEDIPINSFKVFSVSKQKEITDKYKMLN